MLRRSMVFCNNTSIFQLSGKAVLRCSPLSSTYKVSLSVETFFAKEFQDLMTIAVIAKPIEAFKKTGPQRRALDKLWTCFMLDNFHCVGLGL